MASPGIHIKFDIDPLIERTKRAELTLHQHQNELLDILGQMLLGYVQLDYVTKARGGTGEDGIKWDPLKPATIARRKKGKKKRGGGHEIGRDTGKQINTLQPGRTGDAGASMTKDGNSITVGAAMSYSEHFDRLRPIIPEHLPERWLDELQEEATEYMANIIEVELNK